VAHSWECDSSGCHWTFRLREDVRFSNSEPVDAESFVRGINRALDPAANTETGYHLAGVRGFGAVRSGAVSALAGLHAPDAHTLVFELDEVDFEFDKKTLQPVFSPVPTVAGPALNPAYNDQPIGNGPYLMAEPWRHNDSITLRRNPLWFGEPPRIEEIRIDILDQGGALEEEYAGFRRGDYDYARIPGEQVTEAKAGYAAGGGFLERDLPGLHYLIPFCHQAPMDTVAARRAVSAAIDRAGIAETLLSGTRVPADSLLSPWFADVHMPGLGEPYTLHDPDLARKCATEAGLIPGSVVELAYNTGAGHDGWVTEVARQLREVLGLDVRLLQMTAHELVAHRTSAPAAGLCRAGWAYDYPTPDNLLFPLLHSSCTAPDEKGTAHGDNEGRYVNPDFDQAVVHARATRDEAERVQRWQEAERIAMADMALIPLWFRTEYRVFAADRFTGMDLDFFGNPTLATLRPSAAVPAASGPAAQTSTSGEAARA
jgi:oligopeptide transport system substrate-binding protein